MKYRRSLMKSLLQFALMSLLSAVVSSQAAQAGEPTEASYEGTIAGDIKVLEFSKNLKIRGWQLSEGIYMGQAKVAGNYGLGLVIDSKSYSWGINNRGISILKRF